jgi:hypothetical protein
VNETTALLQRVVADTSILKVVTETHSTISEELGRKVFSVRGYLRAAGTLSEVLSYMETDHDITKGDWTGAWSSLFEDDKAGMISEFRGLIIPGVEHGDETLEVLTDFNDDFVSGLSFTLHTEARLGRTLLIDRLFSRQSFSGLGMASVMLDEAEEVLGIDTSTLSASPLPPTKKSLSGITGRDYDVDDGVALRMLTEHYRTLGFVSAPLEPTLMARRAQRSSLADEPLLVPLSAALVA